MASNKEVAEQMSIEIIILLILFVVIKRVNKSIRPHAYQSKIGLYVYSIGLEYGRI